jgi:hypothetical protein
VRLKQCEQIVDVVEGHGVHVKKSSQLEMKPLLIPVLVSLWVIFTTACDIDLALPEPASRAIAGFLVA